MFKFKEVVCQRGRPKGIKERAIGKSKSVLNSASPSEAKAVQFQTPASNLLSHLSKAAQNKSTTPLGDMPVLTPQILKMPNLTPQPALKIPNGMKGTTKGPVIAPTRITVNRKRKTKEKDEEKVKRLKVDILSSGDNDIDEDIGFGTDYPDVTSYLAKFKKSHWTKFFDSLQAMDLPRPKGALQLLHMGEICPAYTLLEACLKETDMHNFLTRRLMKLHKVKIEAISEELSLYMYAASLVMIAFQHDLQPLDMIPTLQPVPFLDENWDVLKKVSIPKTTFKKVSVAGNCLERVDLRSVLSTNWLNDKVRLHRCLKSCKRLL